MNVVAVGNSAHIPLPDGCVQAIITSPVYYRKRAYAGAQDFPWPAVTYTPLAGCASLAIPAWHGALGQEPDVAAFIGHLVLIFREVWRVTRSDGTCAINLGDTFSASGGAHDGRSDNQRGVGAARVFAGSGDGQAARRAAGAVPVKNLIGVPWRLAFALQADGWLLRNNWPWVKTAGLPESVTDRLTVGHEDWFLFAKSADYFYDRDAARALAASYTRQGGAAPYLANGATTHGLGSDSLHQMAAAGHQRRTSDMWVDSARQAVVDLRAQADHLERVLAGSGAVVDNQGDIIAQLLNPRGTKVGHFAAFDTSLVDPLIELLSAARACPRCGMAWRRVTERARVANTKNSGRGKGQLLGVQTGGVASSGFVSNTHYESTTTGWQPACACGTAGLLPGDLDVIATPTGDADDRTDPSLTTGRAGFNRQRGDTEGTRPITRYEQRQYAAQLKAAPQRTVMANEAGPAFDHYLRTDANGARPIPPDLLATWLARGWLTPVVLPEVATLEPTSSIVLDPFMGTGTVLAAATRLGRRAVGFDLALPYAQMAHARLAAPLLDALEIAATAASQPALI